jgi:hypothetical protein
MEFNVYIKIFDKIKEFDVKPSYSIFQVKEYIVKFLKITFEFELYYNHMKLSNGTVMSNNIREDTSIILAPIMKTGKTNQTNERKVIFDSLDSLDSLDSVKDYLKKNFQDNVEIKKEIQEIQEIKEIQEMSKEDIEQNRKTMEKLQMLRQKYLKKN